MKQIITLIVLVFSTFSFAQSKMNTPTKKVTINNAGNEIKPIQESHRQQITTKPLLIQIKKSEFNTYTEDKQNLILKQPEKYVIID